MDLLEQLAQMRQGTPKRKTIREEALNSIAHAERRLRDYKELLALIDEIGEERLERISALIDDRVSGKPDGPHGPGCTCDPEEEEGVTCH